MKFDIAGRINNMRLPDGKAAILYSVYEAVSNSVHAIEDRFGRDEISTKGRITVDIITDDDGTVSEISVSDNGVGLTPSNLQAFETCDTRAKATRGGKGIGRLIWIKVFGAIHVRSRFVQDGAEQVLSFQFKPEADESIQRDKHPISPALGFGTQITLSLINDSHRDKVRKISFLRNLALHFFPFFMSGIMPEITVCYDSMTETVNEFIKDKIDTPVEQSIELEVGDERHTLIMSHMYVDGTISTELKNSILLTAHNRLVGDPISIERKFALNELPDRRAYVGIVKGDFLDQRVDQERMGFKLTRDQYEKLTDLIILSAGAFLAKHIQALRGRQKTTVSLLLVEHPQLAAKVKDIDSYVDNLSPGMDEEQIGENLFTLLYRDERKITKQIREFAELPSLDIKAQQEAEDVLSKVSDQAKHRLAELVVKRRQVLSLAKAFLKYRDAESQAYYHEKAIHDLVCPLGQIYSGQDYTNHNLWIIDDLLAYYGLFASDKQIRVLAPDSGSQSEPDLIFFNPLGFRREGTNDPVVLVEFKRPGDERLSQDPVSQVLDYIEKLRSKTVRDIEGEIVSEIRDNTPFECYVICDLSETARRLLSRSQAPYETPDGEGYYGFAPNHHASIHVISFKKMLRDAELRNEVFFRKLGLVKTSA